MVLCFELVGQSSADSIRLSVHMSEFCCVDVDDFDNPCTKKRKLRTQRVYFQSLKQEVHSIILLMNNRMSIYTAHKWISKGSTFRENLGNRLNKKKKRTTNPSNMTSSDQAVITPF